MFWSYQLHKVKGYRPTNRLTDRHIKGFYLFLDTLRPFLCHSIRGFYLILCQFKLTPDAFRPFLCNPIWQLYLILSVHSNFFWTPFGPFFAIPSNSFTLYFLSPRTFSEQLLALSLPLLQRVLPYTIFPFTPFPNTFWLFLYHPLDSFTLYFPSTQTFSGPLSALSLPRLPKDSGISPLHCPLYHCPLLPPPYRLHPACKTKSMRLA